MSNKGWIGVDLDRTLAHYDVWRGPLHIGAPIQLMANRVKAWVAAGQDVRIFTARVDDMGDATNQVHAITAAIIEWCIKHVGCALPVTNRKDWNMVELWDDRAVQIIPNTGRRADGVID